MKAAAPSEATESRRTVVGTAVCLTLVAVFGATAFYADRRHTDFGHEQDALGNKFGCTGEHPIPANGESGPPPAPKHRALDFDFDRPIPAKYGSPASLCYARWKCAVYGRLSCGPGIMVPSGFSSEWERLERERDTVWNARVTFLLAAFLLGYLVVGWHFHGLILAIMLRFMLLKWALLASLAIDVATVNVVGGVRAIAGLLKLPPREA